MAMALEGEPQRRRLILRFDPATLAAALQLVDERLQRRSPSAARSLRSAMQELGALRSEEKTAQAFWPRLGERLAAMAPSVTLQPVVQAAPARDEQTPHPASGELALLEALTHEVRTPLATIRTLIRSLLRRTDLPAVVRHRLEQIDSECSEQIDRFGLIFHAAELQRRPRPTPVPGANRSGDPAAKAAAAVGAAAGAAGISPEAGDRGSASASDE